MRFNEHQITNKGKYNMCLIIWHFVQWVNHPIDLSSKLKYNIRDNTFICLEAGSLFAGNLHLSVRATAQIKC